MTMSPTLDLIIYISSGLLAAGVLIKTLVAVGRFFRRVNTLLTQWLGDSELQIPGMVDRMEDHARRLADIEEQIRPKGGKTLRERLDDVEREVNSLKRRRTRTRTTTNGMGMGE
ncbi:hypothetical protein ABT332_06465 [Saccharomonospora azurea]|uniref:hypothetical protein n=1 Tax=Saccharomonospora azurea TaxID=40988 RepID=UPI00332794A9